jgi:hypothetical protein
VGLTALELQKTKEYMPVHWTIQKLDGKGNAVETVVDSIIAKPGEDKRDDMNRCDKIRGIIVQHAGKTYSVKGHVPE